AFHVTGVQTCALPILSLFIMLKTCCLPGRLQFLPGHTHRGGCRYQSSPHLLRVLRAFVSQKNSSTIPNHSSTIPHHSSQILLRCKLFPPHLLRVLRVFVSQKNSQRSQTTPQQSHTTPHRSFSAAVYFPLICSLFLLPPPCAST